MEEYCTVFEKSLNCFSPLFTASMIHLTLVTSLESLASLVVNWRVPFKNGGEATSKPNPCTVLNESRKPVSTTITSSLKNRISFCENILKGWTSCYQFSIFSMFRFKMLSIIEPSLFKKLEKKGLMH